MTKKLLPTNMTFDESECAECDRLLAWGLAEDLDEAGDITSAVVLAGVGSASALVVCREPGIVAGLPALPRLARLRNHEFDVQLLTADGVSGAGEPLARLTGPLPAILAVERLALNLLGHLSGIATTTARFVAAVADTKATICDTRKTTPGWRRLEKYAVRVGGGHNHRIGLFDAVLIKDNHLAGLAKVTTHPIAEAVTRARRAVGKETIVQVEVDSLAQLGEALECAPDMILLDNMTTETLGLAVEMRDLKAPRVLLEASGGISLCNVAAIARTGVDRISVGALTHSAAALDIALDYE